MNIELSIDSKIFYICWLIRKPTTRGRNLVLSSLTTPFGLGVSWLHLSKVWEATLWNLGPEFLSEEFIGGTNSTFQADFSKPPFNPHSKITYIFFLNFCWFLSFFRIVDAPLFNRLIFNSFIGKLWKLRIPPHCDHSFRSKLTTDSAGLWPPIPLDCDHFFTGLTDAGSIDHYLR